MRVEQSREIDGFTYQVNQLPARKGLELLTEVATVAGPLVAAMGDKGLSGLLDSEADGGAFLGVAKAIAGSLDSKRVLGITDTLAGVTYLEGKALTGNALDAHFMGRVFSMLKWLAFALEVQFGDFFNAATGNSESETEAA